MKLTCVLSAVLSLGLILSSAWAEPNKPKPATPENFPSCRLVTLDDGFQACAYINLDDWKLVLAADRELTFHKLLDEKFDEKIDNLTLQIASLEGQVDSLESVQVLLADRNEELTRQLIECDRKLQDERSKPRWGNTLAWTVAGASTSVLFGVVLAGVL